MTTVPFSLWWPILVGCFALLAVTGWQGQTKRWQFGAGCPSTNKKARPEELTP